MARPTSRKKSKLSKAVVQLRTTLGDSQQAFANRLGMALQTVARWETQGSPSGKALLELAKLAAEHQCNDPYFTFLEEWFSETEDAGTGKHALPGPLREHYLKLLQQLTDALGGDHQMPNTDPEAATRALREVSKRLPFFELEVVEHLVKDLKQAGRLADLIAFPTNDPAGRLQMVKNTLLSAWSRLSYKAPATD